METPKAVTPLLVLAVLGLLALPAIGPRDAAAQNEGKGAADIEKDGSTEINVKNADIEAIIRIFSKKTKRNYILDERVKGKVSIFLPGKVSSEEAIRILDSVLQLKGFTTVPIGKNLWKIIPAREAKQTTIPTVGSTEGRGSPAVVTRVVNLKYVGADDVKNLLTPLISSFGLINAYTGTNSLIVIDAEENIKRLDKLIESIDVPFSNREMIIIPIKFAEAKGLADTIKDLLGLEGSSKEGEAAGAEGSLDFVRARLREAARRTPGMPGGEPPAYGGAPPPVPGSEAEAATIGGARSRAPKILADERTNSLIVVADEDTTARIRALVSELDSPVDLSGINFYVYRCQHATAQELADVLSALSGGGGGGGGTGRTASSRESLGGDQGGGLLGGSRGSRGSRSSSSRSKSGGFLGQDRVAQQRRTPGQPSDKGARQSPSAVQFGENFSLTADPATNSLIIVGTQSDYEKVLKLIKDLDVKRRQVLVEAVLLEVGIDDSMSTGIEFLGSTGGADGGAVAMNNLGNLGTLFTDPRKLNQFTLAAASAGSLTLPGNIVIPTQTVLMTAASQATNVNVLSAPTILAIDNEEAKIVVGQNVPFLASTASTQENLNNTFNQIDREDVGITLTIKPQISSRDFVTLNIFTEVSNVVASTAGSALGPTTSVRTSESTVIAKDAQMVVIGGLMSDNIEDSQAGIPYLRDVPVLGHLFRDSSNTHRRTNLLIFITPRIIKDQFDLRDTSRTMRDGVQDWIEYRDVQPPRTEVLTNENMNRVTQSEIYEGEKPTTILPPERALDAALGGGANGEAKEPIRLKVSPRLPTAKDVAAGEPRAQVRVALGEAAAPAAAAGSSNGAYVVLQTTGSGSTQGLPFQINRGGVVGLLVPAESQGGAKRFFQIGNRYRYQVNQGQKLPLQVMGVFSSTRDAQAMFPQLEAWHTLSPFEIMNLGVGPWSKAE